METERRSWSKLRRATSGSEEGELIFREGPSASRTFFLLLLIAAAGCRGRGVTPAPPVPRPAHPNVLLIVVDTLRFDDSGVRDPHSVLGELAARGIVFERTYSTFDQTLDSHFSLLTGFINGRESSIDQPGNSIAPQLARVGYRTFGVAANGNLSQSVFRAANGFQRYTCLYDLWMSLPPISKQIATAEADRRIDAYGGKHDDFSRLMVFSNARRAMTVLQSELEAPAPFFGFVNLTDPHDPYFPDPAFYAPSQAEASLSGGDFDPDMRLRHVPARFSNPGMISDATQRREVTEKLHDVDGRAWCLSYDLTADQIERYHRRYRASVGDGMRQIDVLMAMLAREHLLDSTIVIITADHGESFGEKHFMSHALHNRGDREATQRVPLIFLFPPAFRYPRMQIDVPASIADIPPTIYDYTGVDWFPLASITDVGNFGKSLFPYIERAPRAPRSLRPAVVAHDELSPNQQERIRRESIERLRSLGYLQ